MNQWVLSMPKLRFLVCTTKLSWICSWWLLRIGRRNDVKHAAQYITQHQDQAQRDLNCLHQNNWPSRENHRYIYLHQSWAQAVRRNPAGLHMAPDRGPAGPQFCLLPWRKGLVLYPRVRLVEEFPDEPSNSKGHHLKGQILQVRAVLAVYWRWGFGIQCSVSWTSLSGPQAQAGVWRGEGTAHALSSTALHRQQPPVPSHTHPFI